MLVDLVQLRTFVAVAEEQHLTRASERLYMSQSATSTHIKSLEETLGTQLFLRANRSLELMNSGKLLLDQAKLLLRQASEFMSLARELEGKIDGTLVIGTSTEPDTQIGRVVETLRNANPFLTVDLRARNSASGHRGLRSGELDVCVLVGTPVDPKITYYELSRVKYRVAGPLAWSDRIEHADLDEIARLPWIIPGNANSTFATLFKALFADRGIHMNVVATFDNPSLARTMFESGIGLTLLREEYVEEGVLKGTIAASSITTDYALTIGHETARSNDPIIEAFVAAVGSVWPNIKLT